MPNIKFNYLYRDGANYKNFGFVIFDNSHNISLEALQHIIKSKLIDETWFYVNQWHLPDLRLATWNHELDPTWHEFESIEYSSEAPNATSTLVEFISMYKPINHPVISTAGRDLLQQDYPALQIEEDFSLVPRSQ